ncbi:RecQ family ATP-dependent DNA helicase [Occallatibacter savannae]|uniref:RecQ family ATP-dependent DNA helicase n=1 Tax=Occallatibacter savannae TaxID=1002691 RepID=UPI000D697836|nr:ATP-dependent DNA helicase RecQ [Occallatibacter savannae]
MPSRNRKPIDISAAAQKLLGFKSLRPGQREAIQSLLEGRDTLLVQPTGSGKSAVYQIAGSLLAGSTVIISPLIALQKDQADSMEASELDETVVLNSTLSASEHRETLERIEQGEVEFIFLAPEQLRNPDTLDRLKKAGVSLFAIDEAHCISHWGHDFRPDYLELAHVIEALDHPVVLAMTATASKEVRTEIVERLGMENPKIFVHGFDRPNISLRVDLFSEEDEKLEAVVKRVEFAEKPGIVYVATHKHAESLAKELKERGVDAVFYHGGLKAKDRDEIQDKFMKGEVPVIVATNAFGMGVDKPDIRFVYHADVSDSVDAYYQEVGRAGRDGDPAEAVLFYRPGDISAQRYKTGAGRVNSADLRAITDALVSKDKSASPKELSHDTGLSQRKVINIVHKLEEVGAAEKLSSGEIQLLEKKTTAQMMDAATEQQQSLKELRSRRLQQMQLYAEGRSCRRAFLLRYFGDDPGSSCGNCDRCEAMGGIAVAR